MILKVTAKSHNDSLEINDLFLLNRMSSIKHLQNGKQKSIRKIEVIG